MHRQNVLAACALVQVVDVLSDQQELSWMLAFEFGKCQVGCVGPDRVVLQSSPAKVVEVMHELWIASKALR